MTKRNKEKQKQRRLRKEEIKKFEKHVTNKRQVEGVKETDRGAIEEVKIK